MNNDKKYDPDHNYLFLSYVRELVRQERDTSNPELSEVADAIMTFCTIWMFPTNVAVESLQAYANSEERIKLKQKRAIEQAEEARKEKREEEKDNNLQNRFRKRREIE